MRQVNIRIGPVVFDHADYDAENDVLYLHVGEPQEAESEETPEGHVLRYAPGSQRIVGLTILGTQRILDREGELRMTIPESVKASADDLAPALADETRSDDPLIRCLEEAPPEDEESSASGERTGYPRRRRSLAAGGSHFDHIAAASNSLSQRPSFQSDG
jgi:uncharacterized protein YuzE